MTMLNELFSDAQDIQFVYDWRQDQELYLRSVKGIETNED